jgi:hypothetical protein
MDSGSATEDNLFADSGDSTMHPLDGFKTRIRSQRIFASHLSIVITLFFILFCFAIIFVFGALWSPVNF